MPAFLRERVGETANQHTPGHRNCQACGKVRLSIVKDAPLPETPFPDLADSWLKNHKRYIKLRTFYDYQQYIKTLNKFFGEMNVGEIDLANVRAYQDWRGEMAGNQRINIELSALHQILEESGHWEHLAKGYRPLPVDKRGSGQSLSEEDQEKLLMLVFRRREKMLAHLLRLMLKTGCGFGEVRHVKRQDVLLEDRMFNIVEGAKNHERERTIPLIDGAYESMQWLVGRWVSLGGAGPTEYILPCQPRRKFGHTDFRQPMRSIKRSWWTFKDEIKADDPELYKKIETFRIYDCRVTAITRTLASQKVSLHTAKKLFGHVSEQMQRRYFKPDHDLLRDALESAIGGKRA
jgi:integrase